MCNFHNLDAILNVVEEVLVQLAVLKEQLENNANNQEYKIIKEQFPSEEDYCKYVCYAWAWRWEHG